MIQQGINQRVLCTHIMNDAMKARLNLRPCSVPNLADIDCLLILEETKMDVQVEELCFSCKLLMNELIQAHRERIWSWLPVWFRIGGEN